MEKKKFYSLTDRFTHHVDTASLYNMCRENFVGNEIYKVIVKNKINSEIFSK